MTIEEMKARKTELGLTNEMIAAASGIPLSTVQKLFGNVTKAPRKQTIDAVSAVLADGLLQEHAKGSSAPYRDDLKAGCGILREAPVPYHLKRKPAPHTIDEYYALPGDQRVELIDGVFYDMGAPSFVHQRILAGFHYQVQTFLDRRNGPCYALESPTDVRLFMDDQTMVQPDFLIVCDREKVRRWGIMGAPDFVLEIVSESSARRDYVRKVSLYMDAGVKELWLIDPLQGRLLIYTAEGSGTPYIGPLEGKKSLGIYGENGLMIDLDLLREMIEEYPD